MPKIALSVFTKPWVGGLEPLADKMAALGVDGVELPVRPGYQVEPDSVGTELARAKRVLASRGLEISSVAGPTDERAIAACGESGIEMIRIFAPIDRQAGYHASIDRYRRELAAAIPHLERHGVTIGVQTHSGQSIGSASGILRLIEPFDARHVCCVLDMAHCALAGEPTDLALDIIWDRTRGLFNFKSAFRERTNGPEEAEATYRIRWTTGRHAGFSWRHLVESLRGRGFTGTFCLPAEYSDPAGKPQRMGDDVLPFLEEDLRYLRSLLAEHAS